MNLKNYTSSVDANTTISYIETYLADCGVTGISKEFKNSTPVALFFHIDMSGRIFTIRLPAKVDQVHEYLWREYCISHSRPRKTKEDFLDQAAKTAWKIQQDWVQVQMSLIKLKQVDFIQVFMGFVWDGKQTFYDRLKTGDFKQLPEKAS